MKVRAKPDGYQSVIPYLIVPDPQGLLDFAVSVLGGEITECNKGSDGGILHGEVRVGDSLIMVGRAGEGRQPMPAMLYLYGDDCDGRYQAALAKGAEPIMPPQDMFYGDRHGGVRDQNGVEWWFATRLENLSPQELERRHADYLASIKSDA